MRLTVHTDFALRVLIYLAVNPAAKPTIAAIAAHYGVSRNHLMKVVYELGRAGYVETSRGKSGGLRLARPPAEIGVGELVRRTEPDLDLVPCFNAADATCAITPGCRLRGVLFQARAAFLQVLDGYTLADLAANPSELRALLAHRPTPARA